MIGVDTSVLVRYLTQDDPALSAKADKFFDSLTPENSGFIPLIVLVELIWVLARRYGMARAELAAIIETLALSNDIVVERRELVLEANQIYRNSNIGFADCLIATRCAAEGCAEWVTFDKAAAKGAGFRQL